LLLYLLLPNPLNKESIKPSAHISGWCDLLRHSLRHADEMANH